MGKFFLWLFIFFVLGYAIYFGVNWTKVRLDYSSMESEAERLFSPTSNTPYTQVPQKLIEKAEDQDIPLKPEDVKLYIDEWDGYRVLSFTYVDSIPVFKFKILYFRFSFVDTVFLRPK